MIISFLSIGKEDICLGILLFNLIKIFLVPPNKQELEKRLVQRNQDNPSVIFNRLKAYDNDINHWVDYDYTIVNDNLEHCFSQIEKIIQQLKN